jgi:hypothetical protein
MSRQTANPISELVPLDCSAIAEGCLSQVVDDDRTGKWRQRGELEGGKWGRMESRETWNSDASSDGREESKSGTVPLSIDLSSYGP